MNYELRTNVLGWAWMYLFNLYGSSKGVQFPVKLHNYTIIKPLYCSRNTYLHTRASYYMLQFYNPCCTLSCELSRKRTGNREMNQLYTTSQVSNIASKKKLSHISWHVLLRLNTVKPWITNTSKKFIKCRLDNFSMSFILFYINFSVCENK